MPALRHWLKSHRFDLPIDGDVAYLPDAVFNVPVKPHLLHAVVTQQLANRRSANPKVKHRGDVAGSTRKL